jgi:hypothetical protein
LILFDLKIMNIAINFYHQAMLSTIKISNKHPPRDAGDEISIPLVVCCANAPRELTQQVSNFGAIPSSEY